MHPSPSDPPCRLLERLAAGESGAAEELLPLVYGELRRLAERAFARQRSGHTLQPTALVHEAYLKLVQTDRPWGDAAHFRVVAARAMRQVRTDHARQRRTSKRGDAAARVTLHTGDDARPGAELAPAG